MADLIHEVQNSDSDDTLKKALIYLLKQNKEKDEEINQLRSEVEILKHRMINIERYNSKNTIIIRNLPMGFSSDVWGDVLLFFREGMKINLELRDIAACHPLGPIRNVSDPPPIIVRFLYNHHKLNIWARKHLLRYFKNPRNQKAVFLDERLADEDKFLKKTAEDEGLYVTTWKSATSVHVVQSDGRTIPTTINKLKDISDLAPDCLRKDNKAPKPMPRLQMPKHVGSFQRTRSPVRRPREVTPQSGETTLINELSKRVNDPNDLVDYVRGLTYAPVNKQSKTHDG